MGGGLERRHVGAGPAFGLAGEPGCIRRRRAHTPVCPSKPPHGAEITNEHVVPFGYLVTLMTLFMLIVLDRLFYTVGSPLGKSLLLCV